MGGVETKNIAKEKAVLVGLIQRDQTTEQVYEYLDELAFLAETAGAETVRNFVQRMDIPNKKTFIGKGKLEEIVDFIQSNKVDIVIFDDELSPSQLRNIEKILECKTIDRSNLILDIFANRAQTANAKTQVELAQLQYMLPRLTRLWTHLDRQKGGIGLRGTGETQIETDRRIVKDKITRLKAKLEKIDKQKTVQRGNRGQLIRVALVGYTNVGKSTTMNLLSKSDIFAENKLFATLDTTVRKIVIKNIPFLLSDTVGFIRKLPHQLVDSFKSTLDEVREADLLLHVVDITHPAFEDHYNTVNETLREIEALNKPTILVFNKVDGYNDLGGFDEGEFSRPTLEELEKTWMSKMQNNCIFISAVEKINIDAFKELMYQEVRKLHVQRFPYNNFLYQDYEQE
ncbi:MAG: GTPase HflX [Flavobacteriales bacterium]|jgi:GTP-binding protein HflX|nr:GTPase HflX [Flavobacteriales bacterium]